jgi:hypothetical protein
MLIFKLSQKLFFMLTARNYNRLVTFEDINRTFHIPSTILLENIKNGVTVLIYKKSFFSTQIAKKKHFLVKTRMRGSAPF